MSDDNRKGSSTVYVLLTTVLGGLAALANFHLISRGDAGESSQGVSSIRQVAQAPIETPAESTSRIEIAETSPEVNEDVPPLVAEKPPKNLVGVAETAKMSEAREEVELRKRRWTALLLLPNGQGEVPIPDDFNVWNYPKGYSFSSRGGLHHLADYRVDGEFIIRNGYLRREFGNSALLHLPKADDFELEGLVDIPAGVGGWLILLGWDVEKKSGYVIYCTGLRTFPDQWFVTEIKDGKPVANTFRRLVKRNAEGQGALRVFVENGKVSMQAAGDYLFRDEEMPNYKEGHVAIGTFSPRYGPKNIGIKSLRMRLK